MNPKTGFPIEHSLLSASVFAKDCDTADAWGTALMVLGKDGAMRMLKAHPEIDALLIYSTENGQETFVTQGIKPFIQIQN
jgi:thiamine biosynthesis lipoprotein